MTTPIDRESLKSEVMTLEHLNGLWVTAEDYQALRVEAERMAQEARAVALREAAETLPPGNTRNDILAMIDTPAAEALERVVDAEREACAQVALSFEGHDAKAEHAKDSGEGFDLAVFQIAAAIRARKGEV